MRLTYSSAATRMAPASATVLQLALAAVCSLTLLAACADTQPDAQTGDDAAPATDTSQARAIVDSAIARHGGAQLEQARVEFDFRDAHFRLVRDNGQFSYVRTYQDSLDRRVREVLTNDSLYRAVDGERVELTPAERGQMRTTVNSVAYFALLPYPLGDPAVQTAYAGLDTIDGVPYHRVGVTFRQEGGGQDYQDIFMYWFRTDDYAMDYLSYAFGLGEGEELGTRFRKAYNIRTVNGVRFADFLNYTHESIPPDRLQQYSDLAEDSLNLISRVELDSITVRDLSSE